MVDLLPYFHFYVYVPAYTNSLKDIARALGYNWTNEKASGIQSMVWRKKYELTQGEEFKETLQQYNYEDCLALYHAKSWLCVIDNNSRLTKVDDLKVDNPSQWRNADD